jgi:hypothetical protein
MMIWRRALVAATAAAVVFCALAAPVSGQDAPPDGEVIHSWALSPAGTSDDPSQPNNRPNLSYEVDPGAVVEDAVTLYNYSNVPLNFRLYATDAFNDDTGAFSLLAGDEDPVDVGTWVSLAASTVTIPARSQATVPITVKVPADARPGDHVGGLLASSEALGAGDDGNTVTIDRRTGTRLYIRVAGRVEQDLAVESVATDYRPALNPLGGSATVRYVITNRGNVRLAGRHRVTISGPLGFARQQGPEQELEELLPGESITIEQTFDGVPATAVEITKVRLEPSTVAGEDGDLPTVTRSGMALALPITLILLTVAAWLALRARHALVRHRRAEPPPEVQPT